MPARSATESLRVRVQGDLRGPRWSTSSTQGRQGAAVRALRHDLARSSPQALRGSARPWAPPEVAPSEAFRLEEQKSRLELSAQALRCSSRGVAFRMQGRAPQMRQARSVEQNLLAAQRRWQGSPETAATLRGVSLKRLRPTPQPQWLFALQSLARARRRSLPFGRCSGRAPPMSCSSLGRATTRRAPSSLAVGRSAIPHTPCRTFRRPSNAFDNEDTAPREQASAHARRRPRRAYPPAADSCFYVVAEASVLRPAQVRAVPEARGAQPPRARLFRKSRRI